MTLRVPRVVGGGGCAGGGLPLGTVPALSWCLEVSLRGEHVIIFIIAHMVESGKRRRPTPTAQRAYIEGRPAATAVGVS